ncbi:hypothetical protein [Sorangium sp. So ce1389]|uniref:hypothetical protein n=1 Tax=Sorangium sp. So ce1389 TaxID=3133336 RepID=UPI003F621143
MTNIDSGRAEMKMGRIISRMGIVSVCASALVLSGCIGSAEGEGFEEEVGETEQAIGIECAGATATASFTGSVDWVSPQTYNTTSCYKGVVIDVNSINAIGGVSTVAASWADTAPTTQAACEASWVQIDVFQWVSGSWSHLISDDANGIWNSSTGKCSVPGIAEGVNPGSTVRVSATARTSQSSSAPTRKVAIHSGGIS